MVLRLAARDKDWNEEDHPRDGDGRFSAGNATFSPDDIKKAQEHYAATVPSRADGLSAASAQRFDAIEAMTQQARDEYLARTTDAAFGATTNASLNVAREDVSILAPTSKFAAAAEQALPELGARILENERAVLTDYNGNVVLDKVGNATNVSFSPDELEATRGGLLMHSHPYDMGPSPEDLIASAEYDHRAMIAVHDDKAWVVSPEAAYWPPVEVLGPVLVNLWNDAVVESKERAMEITGLDAALLTGNYNHDGKRMQGETWDLLNGLLTDSFVRRVDAMDTLSVKIVPVEKAVRVGDQLPMTHGSYKAKGDIVLDPVRNPFAETEEDRARRMEEYVEEMLERRRQREGSKEETPSSERVYVRDEQGRFADAETGALVPVDDKQRYRFSVGNTIDPATGREVFKPKRGWYATKSPSGAKIASDMFIRREWGGYVSEEVRPGSSFFRPEDGMFVGAEDNSGKVGNDRDMRHDFVAVDMIGFSNPYQPVETEGWVRVTVNDRGAWLQSESLDTIRQAAGAIIRSGYDRSTRAVYDTKDAEGKRVSGNGTLSDALRLKSTKGWRFWRKQIKHDDAGRKAVEELRSPEPPDIFDDEEFWADVHDLVARRVTPIFAELYDGGVEAALRIARRNGVATKDTPEERLAKRAAADQKRLVNEWWTRMEGTIRNQMAELLAPVTEEGAPLDFGAIIDATGDLFGRERAERIAITETTRVMGQAAQATYEELGVGEWEWRTAEDPIVCPVCEDMRDEGPYPLDEVFEPAHVRCRCWPVPVPPEFDDGEGEKERDYVRDEQGRFAETGISSGAAGRLTKLLAGKGGFTYSPLFRRSPTAGKVLSTKPQRERVIEGRVTPDDIRAYVEKNRDLLADPKNHVGGWKDTESGRIYLDVTTIVDTDEEAEALSREHKQEAYYDLSTGEEVRIRARDEKARTGHASARPDGGGDPAVRGLLELRGRVRSEADPEALKAYDPDQPRDDSGRFAAGPGHRHSDTRLWRKPGHRHGLGYDEPDHAHDLKWYPVDPKSGGKEYDPDQPRDEGGRWTSGGGSSSATIARDAVDRMLSVPVVGAMNPRGPFRRVETADEALAAIAKGEYVELNPEAFGVVLEKMHDMAQEAERLGEKAPAYDLCNVSVEGTLFCAENMGVARVEMPQIADKTAFTDHLHSLSIGHSDILVDASRLKATQREIDGVKVAGMMTAARAGKFDLRGERIFVSSDNYVLDGHHRWAAMVGLDWTDDMKLGAMDMPVTRINAPISMLLPIANQYADDAGLARAGFGKALGMLRGRIPVLHRASDCFAAYLKEWNEEDHPRDADGKWVSEAFTDEVWAKGEEADEGVLLPSGATVSVTPTDEREVTIDSMRASEFGQGQGREAMKLLTDLADERGVSLRLLAYADGREGLSQSRLVKWYERAGFVKGEKEPEGGVNMVRAPRGGKEWNEEDHPRDETGKFSSGGGTATMERPRIENWPVADGRLHFPSGSIKLSYDGPAPGQPGARAAASAEYPFLVDGSPIPTTTPDLPGAITVVDTPEILAERQQWAALPEIILTPQEIADYVRQQEAEDANKDIQQDKVAVMVWGMTASAKSTLVADVVAEQIGARLADSDITKGIIGFGEGITVHPETGEPIRQNGADGAAGILNDVSRQVVDGYVANALERGDNLVWPKIGDKYDRNIADLQRLEEAGYRTKVFLVDIPADEGGRRSVVRYYDQRRFVDPAVNILAADSKPPANYDRIKAERPELAHDGFTKIDNSGPIGSHTTVDGESLEAYLARLSDDGIAVSGGAKSLARGEARAKGHAPGGQDARGRGLGGLLSRLFGRRERDYVRDSAGRFAETDAEISPGGAAVIEALRGDISLADLEKRSLAIAEAAAMGRLARAEDAARLEEARGTPMQGDLAYAKYGIPTREYEKVPLPPGLPGPSQYQVNRVDNFVVEKVAEVQDQIIAQQAIRGNYDHPTFDEVERAAVEGMKAYIDNSDVAIRVPLGVLDKIIEDGGIKNQHETGTTMGMLAPGLREQVERAAFGIPREQPPSEYPVYGYLQSRTPLDADIGDAYGDVRILLNDDVKERTTFSIGDSLGSVADFQVQPVSLKEPTIYAADSSVWETVDHHAMSKGELAPRDVRAQTDVAYWETQIHGGVTLDDVKSVEFTPGGGLPTPETVEALHEKGIEVRGLPSDWDEVVAAEARGVIVDRSRDRGWR